ncbi:hypothetical protein RhiirA5_433881, partial [Rhizophagus irregularis]
STIKLISWNHNSIDINFDPQLNNESNSLANTEIANNIDLNICIISSYSITLKIDNRKEEYPLNLIGDILIAPMISSLQKLHIQDQNETPLSLRKTPSSLRKTPSSPSKTPSSPRKTPSFPRKTPSSLRKTPLSLRETIHLRRRRIRSNVINNQTTLNQIAQLPRQDDDSFVLASQVFNGSSFR